jgi:predicted amidohydrolase YtcJ
MRVRGFPIYTVAEQWEAAGVQPNEGDSLARIAGFKLIADGSNQGFTGLQREPYLGTNDRGLAYTSAEQLQQLAATWAGRGWRLALHANGDAAIDNVLDALEHLRDAGLDLVPIRPRIEHCSILHDEQIARMKDLGVSASFLIGHVHYWGVALRDRVLGPERAELLCRCASVERAGIGFTIHSDFTVSDPEPLNMMQMAVTRRTWEDPAFVLNPVERISVESAIRALTSEAAWQLGSEHEVGSLAPGKFADFVILDRDPRSVDPETIRDVRVSETWFNGERVYQA